MFLSLIFLLLLTLVSALIESASIRLARNNRRADLSLSLESVFAEYDTKLLDGYHIFALDGAYGTPNFSYENVLDRLSYYGAESTKNTVAGVRLLTDENGKEFYRLALQYEAERLGIGSLLGTEELDFWEEQDTLTGQYEQEKGNLTSEITGKLEEAGETLPAEGNPINLLADWQQTGVLSLLLGETGELSDRAIAVDHLPSYRKLRTGTGEIQEQEAVAGIAGNALFGNYLLRHFSHFTNQDAEKKVCYEVEYLLGGEESDKENLEKVLNRILLLRFPINYVYLQTDTAKKAEADAMAASLCTLLTVPGITGLVKQAILLAWAYGESVMDLRVLAKGEKIPTIKTKESWQLQLSSLANLGNSTDTGKSSETGLSYEEYMRILLLLEKKETLCIRALDLMEHELGIPMDNCITGLRIASDCRLRLGLRYLFHTEFSYQ